MARPSIRFENTNRWLRGRILDRLRDAPAAAWIDVHGSVGDHGPAAVKAAVTALACEGLLEVHADQPGRARLTESF